MESPNRNLPVDELNFKKTVRVRILKAFNDLNIKTLGDLLNTDCISLIKHPIFGMKCIEDVHRVLRKMKLSIPVRKSNV